MPRFPRLFQACLFAPLALAFPLHSEPVQPLDPAKPTLRTLKAGEAHSYSLALESGARLRLSALQKGMDLVLSAFGPDGKKLVEVDGPTGSYGPETLTLNATATGIYTFEVKPLDSEVPPGRYELRVEVLLTPDVARRYAEVALPATALRPLLGTYELAPGHRVTVNPISGLGGDAGLLFTDLKTRETRLLHPRSASSFFAGESLQGDFPVALEVDRTPHGLRIQWKGKPAREARKLPLRTEEITFRNGDVTLTGTLVLPEGKGPFPAVVYAHGSGPLTRDSLYGATFYPLGVAYFSFDKRGTGQSTGNWRTASLEELAADVLAGMQALKTRPDIRGNRIGVIGISQGGWVGSLAARSKDVAFLVAHSGSGMTVAENIVWEQLSQVKAAGLPPEQIAKAELFLRRTGRMATEGKPWEEIHAAYEAVKSEPFAAFAFPAALPRDNSNWEWFRKNGNVDSAVALRQVACPVLWFLGDLDTQVCTVSSEPRLREAFRTAGNQDATLRVMPNASHMLLESRPELHGGDLGRFVPGFWEELETWGKARAHQP